MAAQPIEFDTPRLAFRVWQARHRAPFAAMNADPEVMRHFPAPLTPAQSDGLVDRCCAAFAARGWGLWAVQRRDGGDFIGFIGLSVPPRSLPFGPCVEVGWRLQRAAWGQGYATEGGLACLRIGFERLGLDAIVSFTSRLNGPSIAVMRCIGLRDAQADFDHPGVPADSPLRRHVLYRLDRAAWRVGNG